MISEERLLAMACRCKLLTGSWDGATRSCECPSPDRCRVAEDARQLLYDDPKVAAARERNRQEFGGTDDGQG